MYLSQVKLCNFTKIRNLQILKDLFLRFVCVCVCVCVYVCLCGCMLFQLKGILLSTRMLETYPWEKVNDTMLWSLMQCLCQFFSSPFFSSTIFHLQRRSSRSPSNQKENDIIYNAAQRLMIENIFHIGYKSTHLPKRIREEKILNIWRLL